MGRVVTPKYRVETRTSGSYLTPMCWVVREHGRANERNLERWRVNLNESFKPGGVNAHYAKATDVVPHVHYARIVNQFTGEVVAETRAPMFEIV